MSETIATTTPTQSKAIVVGRFNGAFAPFQVSCFYDLKAAGINPMVAHKLAFDYGSDIGNAIRNAKDEALASKIGKAKSNGESRITLSGGGTTKQSRTMSIYRVVQQLDGLYREKLLTSRELDTDTLSKDLREYLDECEVWVSEHEFATE